MTCEYIKQEITKKNGIGAMTTAENEVFIGL